MHDSFSKDEQKNVRQSRRVNDYFANATNFAPPEMLFGEFWWEGELTLFFGAAGTRKSILAMQMADSIARGKGIDGFNMGAKRQKVLYVDLVLSEKQFQMRYLHPAAENSHSKHHQFSQNLYRERPGPEDELCKWLRSRVEDEGYKTIIIDDINALRETCDGTRETLKAMREMRRLAEELEISVLVLAESREPGWNRLVSEADLQRSRALCEAADSVFAIGRHPKIAGTFYLTQTRSRNAPISWNTNNAPVCWIERTEDGNLIFKFDKRFVPEIDEELRQMICNVKWRKDAGATYRCIADELGISTWKVGDLLKKWRPDIEPPMAEPDVVEAVPSGLKRDVEAEEDDAELRRYKAEVGLDIDFKEAFALDKNVVSDEIVPDAFVTPASHSCAERPALLGHLKRSFDKNDREIFVEREDENGRPIVWYMYDTTGQLRRCEFKGFGTTGRHVDGPICLFNTS